MKKILFIIATGVLLSIAACGSKADYDAISKKVDNQEQLSSSDYSAMLDYMEAALDKMSQNQENIGEIVEKEYPYYEKFALTVAMGEAQGILDNATKKRADEISKKVNEL